MRSCNAATLQALSLAITFFIFANQGFPSETSNSGTQTKMQVPTEVQRPGLAKLEQTAALEQSKDQSPEFKISSDGYVLAPISQLKRDENVFVQNAGAIASILSAIAWPSVVLIGAFALTQVRGFRGIVDQIFEQTTELGVAGVSIKMNRKAVATIEDLSGLIAKVPDTHREWLSNSHIEVQFGHVVSGVRAYLTSDACGYKPLTEGDFNRFRFTLHVPDVILAHSLRQLVGYIGSDRGKAGRLFSIRLGIIGKAWRLESSQYAPQRYSQTQLIEQWGMTPSEAKDTTGEKDTHFAICIKNQEEIVLGVLYADTSTSNFFSDTRIGNASHDEVFKKFEMKVQELSNLFGLTKALCELENARKIVQQFDPYQTRSA